MPVRQYLALLRGINVGGRNPVAMTDLRAALEGAAYGDVRTYIQSGNVLFTTSARAPSLEADVERVLEERFGIPIVVVVRSHAQVRNLVTAAPEGFGTEPDRYHSDAVFLKAPLRAAAVMGFLELRDGVDRAWPGRGVVYFQRLSAERTRSRMSRIVARPEYQQMTIRSWSTTTKLLAMLDAHPGA